jgi:hypothetical protein
MRPPTLSTTALGVGRDPLLPPHDRALTLAGMRHIIWFAAVRRCFATGRGADIEPILVGSMGLTEKPITDRSLRKRGPRATRTWSDPRWHRLTLSKRQ